MPVKAILVGVAIAAAAGYALYENREHVIELADRSRAKLAALLRRLADEISSEEHRRHEEEVPMAGRSFGIELNENRRNSNPFDDQNTVEPPVVSGRDSAAAAAQPGLRHRSGGEQPADVQSSVLFENSQSPAEIPVVAATAVTAATTAAVVYTAAAADDVVSESGNDTAHQPIGQITPIASSRTVSIVESDAGASNPNPFENSQPFWSIHEWQESTVQASPSEAGVEEIPSSSPSLAGSAAEELDNINDLASEVGSVASWTEVASEFSDYH
jgi:hypothetical protein